MNSADSVSTPEQGSVLQPDKTLTQEAEDVEKIHPPNRKVFEEQLSKLIFQIKEKEGEMEKIKSSGGLNIVESLSNLKEKRSTTISLRKNVDVELEKLKKILPEKMCQLGQLESALIYKSDERINSAIQRLEYSLNVQHFKLAEEKKIVSEIDRLKRSKKTLVNYLALKQEISTIRNSQRHMREERDTYFHTVTKLNSDEDRLRRNCSAAKLNYSSLKLQVDELYENKRHLVFNFRKLQEEMKDKQKRGSWKKRGEHWKSAFSETLRDELQVETADVDKHWGWCHSLISVLSRYVSSADQEPSSEEQGPSSSIDPIEEIEEGQFVLLKKSLEDSDSSHGIKRPSKKNRRLRRVSSVKKLTLSPDMMQQLAEMGLSTPSSVQDVIETIEHLKQKKELLEQEQNFHEVGSDTGLSATESTVCHLSRQVSKTESYEGAVDITPGENEQVALFLGCEEMCQEFHDVNSRQHAAFQVAHAWSKADLTSEASSLSCTVSESEQCLSNQKRMKGFTSSSSLPMPEACDNKTASAVATGSNSWTSVQPPRSLNIGPVATESQPRLSPHRSSTSSRTVPDRVISPRLDRLSPSSTAFNSSSSFPVIKLSPTKTHRPLTGKLSSPSSTSHENFQQKPLTLSKHLSQPTLFGDDNDFPTLSESFLKSRTGACLGKSPTGSASPVSSWVVSSSQQAPGQAAASQVAERSTPENIQDSHHFSPDKIQGDNQMEVLSSSAELPDNSEFVTTVKSTGMTYINKVEARTTEKWVESSLAFAKDFIPVGESSVITEITRL